MSASGDGDPYRLLIDGFAPESFRVRSLVGKEALSEAYSFDVVVTGPTSGDVERGALGARAVLVFNVREEERAFHGIVAGVRVVEAHRGSESLRYDVRVVPRLWLLKRKRRTRIFQKMRVPDIVSAVLAEAGIAVRWQLVRAYPEREYCTQYEETDYRFVKRLLAEAGIFFYFPSGPMAPSGALAADAALGAAGAVGGSLVGSFAGGAIGGLVGSATSMAASLIPGDTVICADDASFYPTLGGDDPAALAASTAAALAPSVGDMLGMSTGVPGAIIGTASAVAGMAIGELTGGEAPAIQFLANSEANVTTGDKVTRFTLRNQVKSTGAMFRDYDPDRPLVRLQSVGVSTAPFPPSPFEIAAQAAAVTSTVAAAAPDFLPAAAAGVGTVLGEVSSVMDQADALANEIGGALGQKVPFEVYEHHSAFLFPKWAFAGDEASRILRQKRRRASVAEGEGGCSDFSPGHRFALASHPAAQLDGPYTVTWVEHRGETISQAGAPYRVYWNRFEVVPAEMPYPPARPKRKSVQVSLTATVVGPPGEEIHVDPSGQIRVQFHWDREGRYDDRSSCWIRTLQPWAGAAWGHQFIPRVGMEVVVVFEGGDPDKPMVLGSLYNGTHPPPFQLPQNKTRSGIKTHSTPRGHGHNELSFEDQAGHEQVYIHAQKNYDEVIEHNQTSHVRGARSVRVDASADEHIGQGLSLGVGGSRTTNVGHDDHHKVGRHAATRIEGDRALEVQGDSATIVHKSCSVEVHGHRSLMVGSPDEPGQSDHHVHGSASLGADERIVIKAGKGLVITCGDSSIEMTEDKIVLKASAIEISPKKSLECSTKGGPSMTMGEDVEILSKKFKVFTESGALEIDKEVKAKGDKIKLGYDPSKPSKDKDEKDPETKPFECKLSDYYLNPYAGKKYHLMVEGLRIEGETDGGGVVKQDIPKATTLAVVRLWLDDYPQGRQQVYQIALKDELPPAKSVLGAKMRLKNLGYFKGHPNEAADDDLREALLLFQEDHKESHGLPMTGELDEGTAGALEEIHEES